MTLIQLTEKDLVGQDNPLPMLKRVNDWHELGGSFELEAGSTRTKYKVEARFPSDEKAKEFLLRVFEDEAYAEQVWRQQP